MDLFLFGVCVGLILYKIAIEESKYDTIKDKWENMYAKANNVEPLKIEDAQ